MNKIVTWSIINNEIDFIKDIIEYHLSWVDGMYFLDNGSTDGTLEIIKEFADIDPRVHIDEYPIKYVTQYEKAWHEMTAPFPEVEVRNAAIEGASKIFSPDWLVQLDGDEVFLPTVRDLIEKNPQAECIGHSSINPVCKLNEHPMELRGNENIVLYDPHARIWKDGQNIKYVENPAFKGHQYHCIPVFEGAHLFNHPTIVFVSDPIHFHLHWMYGVKFERFFKDQGILEKSEMVKTHSLHHYSEMLPIRFWEKQREWFER